MAEEFRRSLSEYETALVSCNRCAKCNAYCPLFNIERAEPASARGKIRMIRSVMEGEVELSERVVERMFEDLLCGNCDTSCPAGIDISVGVNPGLDEPVMIKVREAIVSLRLQPRKLVEVMNRLERGGSIYGEAEVKETKANRVYIPGGLAWFQEKHLVNDALKLMSLIGLEVEALNGISIGVEAYFAGYKELSDKLFERFRKIVGEDVEVITEDASHYYFLKKRGVKARHLIEVLYDALSDGRLKPSKRVELKASYHDPCYLGRAFKVYDEPRSILEAIPGVSLVEMSRSRVNSRCCGGLLTPILYPETAERVAEFRVKDAIEAGAEAIVTSCPTCYHNLKNKGLKVYDLVELLAMSLQ